MTNKDFQKKYKVNLENTGKSNINQLNNSELSNTDKAYKEQIKLRDSEEYEKRTDESFIKILELFCEKYKGVGIDCPIGRAKSDKSLREKVRKLEIERLCTIYEIDDLDDKEKESLYQLIIGKSDKSLHKKIYKVMNEKTINLKLIDSLMKEKDLNDNVKMALLRIARIRLGKEEKDEVKKTSLIQYLEYNYGEEAAKRTGKLPLNLMHWENVESVKNASQRIKNNIEKPGDKEVIEKLYDPEKYLKLKDIRGFRIVIATIPDEQETDNELLRKLIDRKKDVSKEKMLAYNDSSCIAIEKDFADFIEANEELLQKMNLKLIARKEKDKQNGYKADHLKFCCLDNEQYTFEIQIRSMYRDDMARGDGPAGHKNRKKRNSLDTSSKMSFAKQTGDEAPHYSKYPTTNGTFTKVDCTKMEDIMVFYFDSIDINSKEFKKAIEYSKDNEVIEYWKNKDKEKGEER